MEDCTPYDDIYELPKDDLLDLIVEYDNYIQRANEEDRYSEGWCPVCIAEFYSSEFQLFLKDREDDSFGDVRPPVGEGYSDPCIDDDIHGGTRSAGDY